jgi:hypothetical protein
MTVSPLGAGLQPASQLGAIVRESIGRRSSVARLPSPAKVGASVAIAVGGAGNDTEYVLTFSTSSWSAPVSVTTDSSSSADELGAAFAEAIAANGLVGSVLASVSYDATGDIINVVFLPGAPAVVVEATTNPSSHLTPTPAAATSWPAFKFGRAARVSGIATPAANSLIAEEVATVAAPASQVVLFDIGHSASQTYVAHVLISGPSGPIENKIVTWAAGGNAGATATAAKAAIDAALAGYMASAVATNDVNVTMFPGYTIAETTAPTAGTGTLVLAQTQAAGAYPALTLVGQDDGTPVFDALGAVVPPEGPLPGVAVTCHDSGAVVCVDAPGAVTFGSPVFVEFAAGANLGKLYTAASATRGPTPWKWVARDPNAPSLAHVAI